MGFGTYDAAVHPRVGVLLAGLAEHGATVAEVTEPLGLDTAARVELLRNPHRVPMLAVRLLRRWVRLGHRGWRTARRLDPDVVVVGYLGHFDVLLARALFPRRTIVLDHLVFAADTAADRGSRGGVVQAGLRALDGAALRAASVVVVDTAEHAAMVTYRDRSDVEVVDVGAAQPWFDAGHAAPARAADAPLRVVFFGLFTPLHGTSTIGDALALLAGSSVDVLMIGGGQDHAEAVRRAGPSARVRWEPWITPDELPGVVAAHDVCLGIVGDTPKSLRVVPNKVFQGAAAGCAVITSDTAAQRRALGDAAVFVPPADAAALAEVLSRLAGDPGEVHRLRAAARARADAHFTASAVVEGLIRRLAVSDRMPSATPPGSAPPLSPRASLRWDLVRRTVDDLAPQTILEIGCGQGAMGARLTGRTGTYVAVEPDPASCAVAQGRIEPAGGTVLNGDHTIAPAAPYDLLCAFEVLEHIDDHDGALADWVRLVRPGGHVLLSVPAWPQRFGASDRKVGHFRRYTPEDLTATMTRAGLRAPTATLYGWPLGYALEWVGNVLDERALSRGAPPEGMAERSATSGRNRQTANRVIGAGIRWGTAPFLMAQRKVNRRGIGIVALAQRPEQGAS